MKIATSALLGRALDYAVSIACNDGSFAPVDYSTKWEFGGPIISQHIFLLEDLGDYEWQATAANNSVARGDTLLQAVCRAYVASKLGDEVEIPEELL